MKDMQTEVFAPAALSNWIRASANSFRSSQTFALLLRLSHCLPVQAIRSRWCCAAGTDYPMLGPSQAVLVSDYPAGQRQLQGL
jgi:hypothetical protein